MALDLPIKKGVSNIPNVLKGQNVLIPTGYGTAATNQTENIISFATTQNNTWETAYTVPTGKTFYITQIHTIETGGTVLDNVQIGIGATPDIIWSDNTLGSGATEIIRFEPIPLKVTTQIQVRVSDVSFVNLLTVFIGWEE